MIIVQPDNITNARTGQPNRALMLPYNPGPSASTAETNYFSAAFPLVFTAIGTASKTANNIVTPAGSEAIVLSFGRTLQAVQVTGTFTASVKIEVTLDDPASQDAQWIVLDTISAASLKQYSGIYYAMRISISAYTSGSVNVKVQMQR